VREHAKAGTEVVDGLRGIAILVVFGFHSWLFSFYTPPPPFDVLVQTGYLGVELFFLISGFCLFFPYARHALDGASAQSVRTFAYRRFIKIVPSYVLALTATTFVALPLLGGVANIAPPLLTHALFLNNWYNDPLGGTNSVFWSLGVEVQFYLIFPLLALAFARRPLLTVAALVAIALGYRYAFAGCCLSTETIMRQVPAFLDIFALGMFSAYAVVYARTRLAWTGRARLGFTLVAWASLVVLWLLLESAAGVEFVPQGRDSWNLLGRTGLALTLATLVISSCLAQTWWRKVLANPVLVFISVISYNLYLWHTLIELWLIHHHLPPTAAVDPHSDEAWKPWFLGLSVALSTLVSTAVTYFIERPLLETVRPHRFAFPWTRLLRRTKPQPAAHEQAR
jgi:peptidoglycan/LPS O-acetylase OafA/YrhL